MICIDTNILIYAHRKGTAEHRAAQMVIERAASDRRGWGFALPTVGEFWAQVTHPRYPGGPSTPAQAGGFLRNLVDTGHARVFMPDSRFFSTFLDGAQAMGISGPRIFDLQIALAALHAGATRLWTHDSAFVAVHGLRIEDPLA